MSVNYVVEIIKLNNVLMKESLVWEWIPLVLTQKKKIPDGKSKSVDCSKPQRKQPTIRRLAQSVNGITNLVKYHHTRGTLTPENLLELDPRKDQLGMGYKQNLLDSKTKAWVDEQNRMNKEKTLGYDKSREEARDTKHSDPQINIESSTKSLKRGTVISSEKGTHNQHVPYRNLSSTLLTL